MGTPRERQNPDGEWSYASGMHGRLRRSARGRPDVEQRDTWPELTVRAGSDVRGDPPGRIGAMEVCEHAEGLERLRSSNWKSIKHVVAEVGNRHRGCSTAAHALPPDMARRPGEWGQVSAL